MHIRIRFKQLHFHLQDCKRGITAAIKYRAGLKNGKLFNLEDNRHLKEIQTDRMKSMGRFAALDYDCGYFAAATAERMSSLPLTQ